MGLAERFADRRAQTTGTFVGWCGATKSTTDLVRRSRRRPVGDRSYSGLGGRIPVKFLKQRGAAKPWGVTL